MRLGERHLGLRLAQRGGRRVDLLLGRRLFGKAALALIVGLGPDLSRLRRGELSPGLLQLGRKILPRDFGAELQPGELGLGDLKGAFGGIAVLNILPRIDVDQRFALAHELIVVDVEGDDESRDLRRDRHRASVRVGVVRRLDVEGGEIEIGAAGDGARRDEKADEQKRALLFRRRRFVLRRGLVLVRFGAILGRRLGDPGFRRPFVPLAQFGLGHFGFGLLIHPVIRSTCLWRP